MNEQDELKAATGVIREQFRENAVIEHIPGVSAYDAGFMPKSEIALQELLEGCIDRHTLTAVLAELEHVLWEKAHHTEEIWQDAAATRRWNNVRKLVAIAKTRSHVYGL